MNYEEYDVPNQHGEFVADALNEIENEGMDCAAVDLLVKLARDGDLDTVAEVLGGVAAAGRADWSGEIVRMIMWSSAEGSGAEPDYATAAAVLSYIVDLNLEWAHKMVPSLIVYQQQGPDCYDFAMTVGHMVKARKVGQATKLLLAMYSDESPQGQNFKSLVPCLLGTLIDFQHADWALALVQQLCIGMGRGPPDYGAAGWCLAQHVYFGRPDWAAVICNGFLSDRAAWYNQGAMMQSVASWGGDGYAQQIMNSMGGNGLPPRGFAPPAPPR